MMIEIDTWAVKDVGYAKGILSKGKRNSGEEKKACEHAFESTIRNDPFFPLSHFSIFLQK